MKPTSQVVENLHLIFNENDANEILASMRWSDSTEIWLFDWEGMAFQVNVWGDVELHSAKFTWGDE